MQFDRKVTPKLDTGIDENLLGNWQSTNNSIIRFETNGALYNISTESFEIINNQLHFGEVYDRIAGTSGIEGKWRYETDDFWEIFTYTPYGLFSYEDSFGSKSIGFYELNGMSITSIERRKQVFCQNGSITIMDKDNLESGSYILENNTLTITLPSGNAIYTKYTK